MKDRIILNFLDYVTIRISGCENTINNIKEYFPNLINNEIHKCDYSIEFKDGIPDFPNIPLNWEKVIPFKGPEYCIFEENGINYAFSNNSDEFCDKHLIKRENNKISIYSSGSNYEMIATRICREIIFRTLLSKGFMPIHASAVSINNKGYLFIGKGGSGKSTAMLYNVLYNKASPISNDIVMIGKKDNETVIVGMPFKITVASDILNLFGYKCSSQKNKLRFTLSDFEKKFKQNWVWESILTQTYLLKYNSAINNYNLTALNLEELKKFIEQVLIEENFNFGDYLKISDETYSNDYMILDTNPIYIEGNIIDYFKRSK